MKRIALTALLLLLPMALYAETEEVSDGVEALLHTIDLQEWDEWFRKNCPEGETLPSEYLQSLSGTNASIASGTVETLFERMLPSLKSAALRTVLYLGIAILFAALDGVTDATAIGDTARTAFRVSVSGAVLVAAFFEIRAALETVQTTDKTVEILLPPLIGFLTLSGMENTAALLPATYALLSETLLRLIGAIVVPLSVLGGVLLVLDVGGTGRLSSIGRLLLRAAKWLLGTACALFLIVTSVRAAAAGSADGLLLKTTKLAAGSIPSIGALLTESVDAGYQCLKFVRSILGLTGCVVILSVSMKPVLSVAASRCALRASALLAEPLSGKPFAELLRGIGDTLHNLMLSELAAIAAALLMLAPLLGAFGSP